MYGLSIEYLDLPVRVRNRLLAYEINTIRDLNDMTDIDILNTPDFGMRSLKAIRMALANFEAIARPSCSNREDSSNPLSAL